MAHSALFHEIREKIALAFEKGFMIFLTDKQLENYTNEIYSDIDKLRNLYPAIPFEIVLHNPAPQVIFVGVQTDPTIYKVHEQITSFADIIAARLVHEYREKNPDVPAEHLDIQADLLKSSIRFRVKRVRR